ncbi:MULTISPECIES: class I SAM-dependent methyltransferase [Streptomyces]|uniref:Class I SAM-dependent methyltransferase n=1 Tax=Streptomyces tsukubensis (strain DSM 42081 / NBRC 108919 / NRRL 18488 / 9993) TaxID=1114943 RepID=I2NBP9_STRT9|nr:MULTISPECIES: class I SAM-dependent methyltransferase [Streptomyces]AZK98148.1 SAM-dependent methyltransferase [Streptomyces tsukubensis]EIF94446.1 type 11 methyltransferase [Streptomyces tsukubensis NRRL18488]MYS63334.1 methyltransferase domain-containing protein [Streptomyces sp. SID5473]QKM65930.1 class I SAM-dependent methyltransferase [Streptomyces tsukubensis NRRL18488]TAI42216.1 class I SAM-dependent methyltransferase [Streptomyces tsukubensis]
MPATPAPDPAAAFDAIGASYEDAFAGSPARRASLDRLQEHLAPGSRILDIGCGTGRPTASTLAAAGHDVLGIDVSPVMVALAVDRVPGGTFRRADIRELPLEEESYDAVCAYFSLLQMDRADQIRVLHRITRALAPGGLLAVGTVPLDVENFDAEFMGSPIRFTSFGAEPFKDLLVRSGLTVLWEHQGHYTPRLPDAEPEAEQFLVCRRT